MLICVVCEGQNPKHVNFHDLCDTCFGVCDRLKHSGSPELKHGIFSFYVMKGLEGTADLNGDGKITMGELQSYLADVVPRQAMKMNRKQEPQLAGDADRILVVR